MFDPAFALAARLKWLTKPVGSPQTFYSQADLLQAFYRPIEPFE